MNQQPASSNQQPANFPTTEDVMQFAPMPCGDSEANCDCLFHYVARRENGGEA